MLLQKLPLLFWLLLFGLPIVAAICSHLKHNWRVAETAFTLILLLALFAWTQVFMGATDAGILLHFTRLNATLFVLISFIALVVLRYSRHNLTGDSDNKRFLRWLVLTVFAVMVTVVSNHLVLFWLAWMGISLSLHQLLMFYPDRPRAALAAHKKFILARLAEVLLGTAFWLLYSHHQTAVISEIVAYYSLLPGTPLSAEQQLAAVLLALVALIKCAQLPVHGWLIQVVESPTPVSALLHAGVVNLGGFLLLVFAPLLSQAVFAQWLLLVIAGLSTIIAALVMMTRISIKVRLAWSTTAQMGLMLIECALGLYELALLHLLAHSCYKAYAFLSAGNNVNYYLQRELANIKLPSVRSWFFTLLVSVLLVAGAAALSSTQPHFSPWVLIAIAIITLFSLHTSRSGILSLLGALSTALSVLVAYAVLKWATELLLPGLQSTYSIAADIWISLLFIVLFAAYLLLQYRPNTAFSRKLFIALNAGFYLDEWATRITLSLWPIRLPRTTYKTLSPPQEIVS